jgi:hypothetical protein
MPPQKFACLPCCRNCLQEIKSKALGVFSNGIMHIQSFVKIGKMVEISNGGHTYKQKLTHHGDT